MPMMRAMNDQAKSSAAAESPRGELHAAPVPVIRAGLAGLLMGLANLVPGVSGGTMVLVMGLYEHFVGSIADLARLKFSRRSLLFLGILAGVAGITIVAFSGVMRALVRDYRSAMFSLFIGMTLAGTPLLVQLIKPLRWAAITGRLLGLGLMVAIGPPDPEARARAKERTAEQQIDPHYALDTAAGALGISAMVLPGISGAHMLLIIGRYETILGSISMMKDFVLSRGSRGDPRLFLGVIVPVGIGALLTLVLFSNAIKWMLQHHQRPMAGFLLGILWGSIIAIWPFEAESTTGDVVVGIILAVAGFAGVYALSLWQPKKQLHPLTGPAPATGSTA
jgi:putative membrane protein